MEEVYFGENMHQNAARFPPEMQKFAIYIDIQFFYEQN